MFSWGEDCRRGFWIKDPDSGGVDGAAAEKVHFLNLSYNIKDLSAGHNVLAFVKTNENAFIIRTNESRDGRRVRGKQSKNQSFCSASAQNKHYIAFMVTYSQLQHQFPVVFVFNLLMCLQSLSSVRRR